jgi:hypothetical protein
MSRVCADILHPRTGDQTKGEQFAAIEKWEFGPDEYVGDMSRLYQFSCVSFSCCRFFSWVSHQFTLFHDELAAKPFLGHFSNCDVFFCRQFNS